MVATSHRIGTECLHFMKAMKELFNPIYISRWVVSCFIADTTRGKVIPRMVLLDRFRVTIPPHVCTLHRTETLTGNIIKIWLLPASTCGSYNKTFHLPPRCVGCLHSGAIGVDWRQHIWSLFYVSRLLPRSSHIRFLARRLLFLFTLNF